MNEEAIQAAAKGVEEAKSALSSVTDSVIELMPYKIEDEKQIAKLWERIRIEDGNEPFIRGAEGRLADIEFTGTELFKIALHSLKDERFKDYISVSAMAFPIIKCIDEVETHVRCYKEWEMSDDEGKDLIPLSEERGGSYRDPWTDENFPADASNYFFGKVLPETCIWVECPECHGNGGHMGKVFDGYGDKGYVTCPVCNGTGKTGAVLCERCHGKGGGYSYAKVRKTRQGFIECEKCKGSGKVRSVLKAFDVKKDPSRVESLLTIIPEGTIPSQLLKDEGDCSKAPDYKIITELSAKGERVSLEEGNLPDCGKATIKLKDTLVALQEECAEEGARYLSETVRIERCVRYVRFRFRFFVPCYLDLMDLNELKKFGGDFRNEIVRRAGKGKLPKGYFTQRHEYSDAIIWLDTATGRTFGEFPKHSQIMEEHDSALTNLLLAMGKLAETGHVAFKNNIADREHTKSSSIKRTSASSKKRWKFVVLGLLFGFLGLHLAYAKRWFLFLLLWAGLIIGGATSDRKGESEKLNTEAETAQVVQPSDASTKKGGPISNIGFAVWGLLWLGGTLFIKKDGKGNRM